MFRTCYASERRSIMTVDFDFTLATALLVTDRSALAQSAYSYPWCLERGIGDEAISGQRQKADEVLADLKAERAALGAKGKQIETEAALIRYVAELLGCDSDIERAIRW